MQEEKDVQAEQKELTVEDLENVAGGFEDVGGIEVGETSGGNKDVKIE